MLPAAELDLLAVPEQRSRISISLRWSEGWRVVCDVTNPSGNTFRRIIYGSQYMGGMNFNAFFPNDWRGAPDLEAGEYTFEWGRVGSWMGASYPHGERLLRDVVTVTPEMLGEPAATTTLEPQRTRLGRS